VGGGATNHVEKASEGPCKATEGNWGWKNWIGNYHKPDPLGSKPEKGKRKRYENTEGRLVRWNNKNKGKQKTGHWGVSRQKGKRKGAGENIRLKSQSPQKSQKRKT